ncbi:unnamed protein product, partial [marine sediment metagenome]
YLRMASDPMLIVPINLSDSRIGRYKGVRE